jgi:hypothetical protein
VEFASTSAFTNVALHKLVEDSCSTSCPTSTTNRGRLTDGNTIITNEGWSVLAQVSGGVNVALTLDLGDYYELCGLRLLCA